MSCLAAVSRVDLPEVSLSQSFEFLPLGDLARASGVCKQWKSLASAPGLWDLKAIFHKMGHTLNILDKKVWVSLFGVPVDDSSFPDNRAVFSVLRRLFRSLVIENHGEITLLALPPLSLRQIIALAPAKLIFIYAPILDAYGDVAASKTHLLAITNNILEGSRLMWGKELTALLEGKGCKIPRIVEALALALLTHLNSSEVPRAWLDKDKYETYTYCVERGVVVGGFTPKLIVNGDFTNEFFDKDHFGVKAVWHF